MINPFEQIIERLERIEGLIAESKGKNGSAPAEDQFFTVQAASEFLHIAVPTLYGLVSRRELPYMKKGKRLFFSKKELTVYLKSGRRKTRAELADEAVNYKRPGNKRAY